MQSQNCNSEFSQSYLIMSTVDTKWQIGRGTRLLLCDIVLWQTLLFCIYLAASGMLYYSTATELFIASINTRNILVCILTFYVLSSNSCRINFYYFIDNKKISNQGLVEPLKHQTKCLAVSVLPLCILKAMPATTLVPNCISKSEYSLPSIMLEPRRVKICLYEQL